MLFVLFTMWFSAGIVPTYFNFQRLGLLDSRMGILLCFAVSTFYVILMRTFFENVPKEMEESAVIDGANDFTILAKIYLPLSTSAIATLTMFYFVDRWNAFFWSLLLLRDPGKVPLQVILRRLIVEASYAFEHFDQVANISEQTLIYATIVIAVLPMLVIYPFIQRFFVKGIMLGAVKG
jgi:putative aldouronate transport system permease protein